MSKRFWFTSFQEPTEFFQRLSCIGQGISDQDHRKRENKWFREAKILGLFSVAVNASKLRVLENEPPDGEVLIAGQVQSIEIVEAFEEGRRPDFEFRTENRKDLSKLPSWDEELRKIPDAIVKAISKKENHNNYPPETILVVYLNLGNDVRDPPDHLVEKISVACNPSSSKFRAICILWRNLFFGPTHIFKGGRVCIDWQLIED